MYAYSPNGNPIVSTKEITPGAAGITEGSFERNSAGLTQQYAGGTEFYYDDQQSVVEDGEAIYLDDNGAEWPACSLVLVEHEVDEDEGLPAALVSEAKASLRDWKARIMRARDARRYSIPRPATGWRDPASFSPQEIERLRPIAQTLALLDGNAMKGDQLRASGVDADYEQYLPEADAIFAANSASQDPEPATDRIAGLGKRKGLAFLIGAATTSPTTGRLPSLGPNKGIAALMAGSDIRAKIETLSPGQKRVLTRLVRGDLNKQIAAELDLTVPTVKAHLTQIFKKLGVLNRLQASLLVTPYLETERQP